MTLWTTLSAEWLKQRRSATGWLIVCAAGFVPGIIFLARLLKPASLAALSRTHGDWPKLWQQSNEAVAIILFPLLLILLTTLVVQLETRNNAWKQVHASPQPLASIFFAKLFVILTAVAAFFLIFNLAIYGAAMGPPLMFRSAPFPMDPFPAKLYLLRASRLYLDGLPIVALQYLLALQLKNFILPLGIGMALWLAAIGGLSWKYVYLIPYGYSALDFLQLAGTRQLAPPPLGLTTLSLGFFVLFTLAGLLLYSTKADRG